VQIASGSEPTLVVYGGTIIPYDLKLIINKDLHDIIRPQWIYDCISEGKRVKLTRKYFFHTTTDRKLDRDYHDKDEIEGDVAEPSTVAGAPEPGRSESKTPEAQEEAAEEDSEMSEWFKVSEDPQSSRTKGKPEAESETDPDSDYDELELRADNSDAEDDWTEVKATDAGDIEMTEGSSEHENVKMGEDSAMEYDQEKIFKHLCFYLDTPENARKHGMEVKSKHADKISSSFADVEDLITANGGQIVDLDEPKLTHIVLDKRDTSRRKDLMKRTAKPKHRNLVLSDFIHACVDEETLLDEEGFAP